MVDIVGKASRDKGKRGEREVAILLREAFPWLDPHRGMQSRSGSDAADVEGTPWFCEVKRVKARADIKGAMAQAIEATDGRPPVVFSRVNGGEWLVTMRAEDWIKQAGSQADEHERDHDFESVRRRRPGWGQE